MADVLAVKDRNPLLQGVMNLSKTEECEHWSLVAITAEKGETLDDRSKGRGKGLEGVGGEASNIREQSSARVSGREEAREPVLPGLPDSASF